MAALRIASALIAVDVWPDVYNRLNHPLIHVASMRERRARVVLGVPRQVLWVFAAFVASMFIAQTLFLKGHVGVDILRTFVMVIPT